MKSILTLTILLTCSAVLLPAFSQERGKSYRMAAQQRLTHIYRSRPRRIDEPLRVENISDNEIREVQAVTNETFPGAIANVSGVTDGCPCEEGPKCDSQVWVLAYRDSRYDGLQLSRIDNHWVLGALQKWWLNYDKLTAKIKVTMSARTPGRREKYFKLREKQLRLQEVFPECALELRTD